MAIKKFFAVVVFDWGDPYSISFTYVLNAKSKADAEKQALKRSKAAGYSSAKTSVVVESLTAKKQAKLLKAEEILFEQKQALDEQKQALDWIWHTVFRAKRELDALNSELES